MAPDVGNFFSAVSCVAWLYYTVVDAIVQMERISRLNSILKDVEKDEVKDEEKTELFVEDVKSQIATAKMILVRQLLYVLPALHWCNPKFEKKPLIGKKSIATMMAVEAWICYYQGWKDAEK